jgi:hypothetical protein
MASTAKFDVWQDTTGKQFYGARAWVKFNGVGTVTINSSANVSSVTDLGVGQYGVNFTTAMPDTNYVISGSPGSDGRGFITNVTNTSQAWIGVFTPGALGYGDSNPISVVIHR